MSKSTMSRLMGGGRKISAGELAVLAHVLDVSVAELIGEVVSSVPEPARVEAVVAAKSRPLALAARLGGEGTDFEAAVGRARELLELTDQFDKLVAAPPLDLAEVPPCPTTDRYVDQGTWFAERVRESLGLGDACIEDVSLLAAERFGLAVAREPLPHDLLGLLVTDEPTGRDGAGASGATLVLVNSEDTYGRQRFTIAHELGHLLFGDADTRFFDLRKSKHWHETRANYFAAALLMPETGVRTAAEKLGPCPADEAAAHEWAEQLVCDVATKFHSSVQSAIYRANTLGFFADAETRRLTGQSAFDMLRRTGHDDYQDVHGIGKNDIDPPKLLADKALYAYAQGLVGIGALARLWKTDNETGLRVDLADAGWVQMF